MVGKYVFRGSVDRDRDFVGHTVDQKNGTVGCKLCSVGRKPVFAGHSRGSIVPELGEGFRLQWAVEPSYLACPRFPLDNRLLGQTLVAVPPDHCEPGDLESTLHMNSISCVREEVAVRQSLRHQNAQLNYAIS